jgi:hypothetical protein
MRVGVLAIRSRPALGTERVRTVVGRRFRRHSAAEKVEPAVTRAIQKVVGEAEGHRVQALQGALADAQQKMAHGGA